MRIYSIDNRMIDSKPTILLFKAIYLALGGWITLRFAAPFSNGQPLHWLFVPLQAAHTDLAFNDETILSIN